MATQAWDLTADITKTTTHYKLAAFKLEYPRLQPDYAEDKPGFFEVYLAPCRDEGGVLVEDTTQEGIVVKIEGAEYDTLMEVDIPALGSILELESPIYNYLVATGRLPAGAVENRT